MLSYKVNKNSLTKYYSGDKFMSVDIAIQEIDDATERTIIAVFEKIDSDINDETDNN